VCVQREKGLRVGDPMALAACKDWSPISGGLYLGDDEGALGRYASSSASPAMSRTS
jgi:hypothetical protein